MKVRFPVRMLVIDRSPAEAAALVVALRRARYQIHPSLVKSLDEVRAALEARRWDLVLIGHQIPGATLEDVMAVLAEAGADAPVIMLEDEGGEDREARIAALGVGVFDVVPRDEPEMLEHTVRRELASLDNRRLISRYHRSQHKEEATLDWLVKQARVPLAIARQTDLLVVNDAFLDLFGRENFDGPEEDGLLACVAKSERDALKAFFDAAREGEDRPVQIELEGLNRQTGGFDLRLDIAPASFHGDEGHRIVAGRVTGEVGDSVFEPATAPTRPARPVEKEATPPLAVVGGRASTKQEQEPRREADSPAPLTTEARPSDASTGVGSATPTEPVVSGAAPAAGGVVDREALLAEIDRARQTVAGRDDFVGVVYVDLDDFAALKSHLGLKRINALVEAVIARLLEAAPEGALVARVADDDFALLIRAHTWDDVVERFRAIEAAICGVVLEVDQRAVLISAGAGLSGMGSDDADALEILDRAYRASQSEIEAIVGITDRAAQREEEDELESALEELAEDLRDAMGGRRLWMVYQPIVRLRGEPIELYEVFIRFRNKHGEMVPPAEFLAAAEYAGMGSDIDLWLVERAIDVLAEQHGKGHRTTLLVKVSEQALRDIRIPLAVGRGIKAAGFPPGRMVLEIAERVASSQIKATRKFMHAVRGLKCGTALEHFGVSRKPFSIVRHIPVDYLTIDRSIVNGLEKQAVFERLKRLVSHSRKLGKLTTAEYVEDARSVGMLYEAGVDFVQGFYIQPPIETLNFEFSMVV
ncbi:MAG: EAL domain-containing protein [Gammaproteobacteria bacterium]|nr:EAL domain-containing protein [Gammaproteobacteria bacterium]